MIPDPWPALILALAVYRTVRFTGWDNFPPVARLRDWATGAYVVNHGSTNARLGVTNEAVEHEVAYRRPTLHDGLTCAFCASVWWATAWYAAWRLWPSWALTAAAVAAASAAVGVFARWLDP